MRAINDTVVVEVSKTEHDASGLQLSTANNTIRYNKGTVITAAPNTVLAAGDSVYYDAIAGSILRHEGKKLLVLRERDIAIIDEKE